MLDYLIKNKPSLSDNELLLKRSLTGILLVFCFCSFLMVVVKLLGLSSDPFPVWIYFLLSMGMLYVNYQFDMRTLTINIFNSILIMLLMITCIKTGGIYSYNVKWFIVMLLLSLLFLPRYQFYAWLFAIALSITSLYFLELGDVDDIIPYDDVTYFVENVIFIVLIGLFLYVMFLTQDFLKNDILKKNQELKDYSKTLQDQSGELELLTHQLRESNNKLIDFAHSTSHDLKQPLNTMSGFAGLVARDIENNDITDRTKEMMLMIQDSSKKIKELINSSLKSTMLPDKYQNNCQIVDPNKVLQEVKERLGFQINETKASILFDRLPSFTADHNQISRVFQNLLSNAMKYAKANVSPVIKVYANHLPGEIMFTVEDNGKGIKQDIVDKIFDPFFQSDSDINIGQGIGLSNCKNIVESFNGRIWAESKLGEFTKIHFSIPKHQEPMIHLKRNPLPSISESSNQNSLEPIK